MIAHINLRKSDQTIEAQLPTRKHSETVCTKKMEEGFIILTGHLLDMR